MQPKYHGPGGAAEYLTPLSLVRSLAAAMEDPSIPSNMTHESRHALPSPCFIVRTVRACGVPLALLNHSTDDLYIVVTPAELLNAMQLLVPG
jgi:hypothetical protein